jgi:proteasome lid subunit RPN8/RPN11
MSAARRLYLSAVDRDQLVREAAVAYPEECCGILLGRRQGAESKVVEATCAVPNTSAVDRRRSYAIDPLAVLAARNRGRSLGREVIGFYHSHPDAGLRPSARDRAEAWPEASYVIVSPRGGVACWEAPADGGVAFEAVAVHETAPLPGDP